MLLNIQGLKITLVYTKEAREPRGGRTYFEPTEDYAVPGGRTVTKADILRFVGDPTNRAQIVSAP